MKKRVSLLIVLTMMVSLTGCNPKKTTMEHYLENVDAKYAYNISKALAEDDDLLSNELGYRSAGSDAEHKAADYIEKEMGKIGLETEKIPVTVDKWQFNSASLKIEGTDIQMMPASYQLSGTSKEGIVTEMVDVGNGTAADYEGKRMEHKLQELFTFHTGEKWSKLDSRKKDDNMVYVYAYDQVLKPEQTTEKLFDSIKFLNIIEGQLDGQQLSIPVRAYAIQTAYTGGDGGSVKEKAREAYGKYVNQNAGQEGQAAL